MSSAFVPPVTPRLGRGLFQIPGLTAQLLAQGLQPRHAMPAMKDLLESVSILEQEGSLEATVRSICTDSRRATPGTLFFALPGRRTQGSLFVEEAVERGAVGVVTEDDVWAPRPASVIRVKDVRAALAEATRRFHRHPERALELIGIAGTSGKTVVASLLRSLLAGETPVGLLGTIHYHLGPRTLPSYRTTPEPVDLYSMLGQMRDYGCRRAILEVSSHGIDQGRVADLPFETVAFLNLSPQHLEYHGSMEAYYDTVKRLFDGRNGPVPKRIILNRDDPSGRALEATLPKGVEVISFGLGEGAMIRATGVACSAAGSRFHLRAPGFEAEVQSPLIGDFNVSNVLAALALATTTGLSWRDAVDRLPGIEAVRGRMERIDEGQPFSVIVDYMHTAASYERGLAALRAITPGRLIVVFGCGGDRDRRTRPEITRTVIEAADTVVATADNPRSEELEAIFADMRGGVRAGDPVQFVENRRHAIRIALESAGPGDLVLVAGKGHETYQEYTDTVLPFDDRAVVRDLLRKRHHFDAD